MSCCRSVKPGSPLGCGSGRGLGRVDVGRQGLLGHLDQGAERLGVVDGQLGQDLAVDLDASQVQALDEAVVGHALGAGRGVDALDPQPAEVALAVLAVPVGVDEGVGDLLLRLAVQPRALAAVAGGLLQDYPALLLGVHCPLDACHCSISCSVTGRGAISAGAQRPSSRLTRLTSDLATSTSPVRRRVSSEDLRSKLWRMPAWPRMILPEPVTLKRFLAPLWVFCFGMAPFLLHMGRIRGEVPARIRSRSRSGASRRAVLSALAACAWEPVRPDGGQDCSSPVACGAGSADATGSTDSTGPAAPPAPAPAPPLPALRCSFAHPAPAPPPGFFFCAPRTPIMSPPSSLC